MFAPIFYLGPFWPFWHVGVSSNLALSSDVCCLKHQKLFVNLFFASGNNKKSSHLLRLESFLWRSVHDSLQIPCGCVRLLWPSLNLLGDEKSRNPVVLFHGGGLGVGGESARWNPLCSGVFVPNSLAIASAGSGKYDSMLWLRWNCRLFDIQVLFLEQLLCP